MLVIAKAFRWAKAFGWVRPFGWLRRRRTQRAAMQQTIEPVRCVIEILHCNKSDIAVAPAFRNARFPSLWQVPFTLAGSLWDVTEAALTSHDPADQTAGGGTP
jgi:hypothetical protein